MDIEVKKIDEYLKSVTPHREEILTEMETYAEKNGFPIIGPLVGRLLYQLAKAIDAKRILELGSGFGYSAFWFARATADDARIICTEGSTENRDLAMSWFKRAGIEGKIDFRVGNALEVLQGFEGPFDIILCDIDKHEYPTAFEMVAPRLRRSGLFITDNIIWSGKVIDQNENDADTEAIRKFTRMAYESGDFFTTIIPLRDGVSLCIKL